MSVSIGQANYQNAYGVNPITLVGGIAGSMGGGVLPLSTLLNGGLITGNGSLDGAFGQFYPLPGASLIENQLGEYPFANLAIAANSIIKQKLAVSLLMRCPVRDSYAAKLSIMTGLQNTLSAHCAKGGTFIVATPSFYYTNCILAGLHEVSAGETLQAQMAWRWDFSQPLISGQQVAGQMNALMSQITNGEQTSGETSGIGLGTSFNISGPNFSSAQNSAPSTGVPSTSTLPYFASGG